MSETCTKCGMPQDLCVCGDISKDDQQITVKIDSRSFSKEVTMIEGLGDEVDLGDLASKLKTKLACGGTAKNGKIELQGDHRRRIEEALEEQGFHKENIEIK